MFLFYYHLEKTHTRTHTNIYIYNINNTRLKKKAIVRFFKDKFVVIFYSNSTSIFDARTLCSIMKAWRAKGQIYTVYIHTDYSVCLNYERKNKSRLAGDSLVSRASLDAENSPDETFMN